MARKKELFLILVGRGGGYFRLSLKNFFIWPVLYFQFPRSANAVIVLQASFAHFTLIQLRQKSEMRNKFVYFVKPAQLALTKSVLQNVFFSIPLFFT